MYSWRMKRQIICACGVVVLLTLIPKSPVLWAQIPPSAPHSIVSSRPVSQLRNQLQEYYGKVITYEEPLWSWYGELEQMGKSPTLLVPKAVGFTMPQMSGAEKDIGLSVAQALDAYHQQTNGPRFRIIRSRLGLHIVPDQVHGASERFEPARNMLDAYIAVPSEQRSASQHVLAIIAAVAATTGVQFKYGLGNPDSIFGRDFAAEPTQFMWGTTGSVARDALVDLFDRSATTFSWVLNCQAGTQPKDRYCGFFPDPIVIPTVLDNGKVDRRAILFDRCAKCPPLPGVR